MGISFAWKPVRHRHPQQSVDERVMKVMKVMKKMQSGVLGEWEQLSMASFPPALPPAGMVLIANNV
jgi:hypothetical protein